MRQSSEKIKKQCLKILGEIPKEISEREHRRLAKEEKKVKLIKLTERVCLRCDKKFLSIGIKNRICESCNEKAKTVDTSYCI